MTTTTSTQVVRDYLENLWNQGHTELAETYLAEDLIQHNANLADGRKALVEFIEGTRKQLPELRFDLRRSAAEGDLVFAHSLFTAQPGHRGLSVIDVFRVVDGVIVEHWDVNEQVPETTTSGHDIV